MAGKSKRLSWFNYEALIAFRYILPSKKQLFTSVISIISFIGIFVGVWALVVVMSVMNGFRDELLSRIIGINGHMVVQNMSHEGFKDYEALRGEIKQIAGVGEVFPLIEGQALMQNAFGRSSGVLVRGMAWQDLAQMTAISQHIKEGDLRAISDKKLIVGRALLDNLGGGLNRSLSLITPKGDVTPFGVNPRIKSYKIGAIFDAGMYEYDSGLVFMDLKEAQSFFNLDNKVRTLEIFLKKPQQIDLIKDEIVKILPDNNIIIDWRERNRSFFSALEIERNAMFIILSLIVLVAALNIISGLIMLVKDKSYDIAILRTMGASPGSILRIFISCGMLIGLLGTGLGLILGLITAYNIEYLQDFVSWLFNVDVFNPQLYFLTKLPAKISLSEVLSIASMAVLLCFIATLIPAWRASRLEPVVALRQSL